MPRKEKKMLGILWGSLQALFASFSFPGSELSEESDLGHTIDPNG